MDLALLILYNLVAVAFAFAGLVLERRRPRLGMALLLAAVLLVINLLVGGAILFVPLILALYGTVFGLPALAVWWLVRRRRARRALPTPEIRSDTRH